MSEGLSTSEFLMKTVRKSNGFDPKVVDAVAEVLWQAEKSKRLEEDIKSHAPEGRNYTNQQYVDLLLENEKYKEALLQIAHGDTWTAYPHDIAAWALGLEKDK